MWQLSGKHTSLSYGSRFARNLSSSPVHTQRYGQGHCYIQHCGVEAKKAANKYLKKKCIGIKVPHRVIAVAEKSDSSNIHKHILKEVSFGLKRFHQVIMNSSTVSDMFMNTSTVDEIIMNISRVSKMIMNTSTVSKIFMKIENKYCQ